MSFLTHLSNPSCEELYKNDPASRLEILKSLAKNETKNEGIAPCESQSQVFCLICLKFPNSSEEEEPLIVSNFLNRAGKVENPLPALTDQFTEDTLFCAKTLVALALFKDALVKRWLRHSAPKPEFYRKTAQGVLSSKTQAHRAISSHHKPPRNGGFFNIQKNNTRSKNNQNHNL